MFKLFLHNALIILIADDLHVEDDSPTPFIPEPKDAQMRYEQYFATEELYQQFKIDSLR
ncbi:MAG: hypothetical protein ACRC1Z_08945 [Waterburya sp.]